MNQIQHVELVVSYNKSTGQITTIGGNTGTAAYPNGKVSQRTFSRWDTRIIGFDEIDYSGKSSPITQYYNGK